MEEAVNHELRNFFKHPDILTTIKSNRLRWAGHIIRAGAEIPEVQGDRNLVGLMVWTRTLKRWYYDAGELKQRTEIIGELNCSKRRPAPVLELMIMIMIHHE